MDIYHSTLNSYSVLSAKSQFHNCLHDTFALSKMPKNVKKMKIACLYGKFVYFCKVKN